MDDNFLPKKKKNKTKILLVFLTLCLFLGISFGAVYFIYHKQDTRDNELNSGLISISFNEGSGNINLTNVIPVIDDVGITNSPYEFSITNTSSVPINAKIGLVIDSSTTIPLGAVRYGLYINDELVEKNSVSSMEDNTLYTYLNMSSNISVNCKIVFWIDYYYTEGGKVFKAKINAVGESVDYIE